jgi:hypothetical protein
MLAIARSHPHPKLQFRDGSSADLGPDFGHFRMVVIGRAFHWMDRAETLRRLDGMIEPGGAVVLVHDTHPVLPDNAWTKSYNELLERQSPPDDHRELRHSSAWVRHEAVLLDSAFSAIEGIWVTERRHTPVERLVDRAFSMSSTSPDRMGDRADDLAREIRALLATVAVDGMVTEVVRTEGMIASRPEVFR